MVVILRCVYRYSYILLPKDSNSIPFLVLLLISGSGITVVKGGPVAIARDQNDIVLGNCIFVGDRQCPDPDIKFYLFTKRNRNDRQLIHASDSWDKSNLSASYFDAEIPTKVIMHGFNSDMFLSSLIDMKDGKDRSYFISQRL